MDADTLASNAAARCSDAALAAGRVAELSAAPETAHCVEWAKTSGPVMQACAEVLGTHHDGDRVHVALALARAGLIAAEECGSECAVHEDIDEACRACAQACQAADSALRALLTELTPAATDASQRASGT